MKKRILTIVAAAFMLGGLATACGDDDDSCGYAPDGVTCQQADGTCEALTCVDGEYQCTGDATEVALIPQNCSDL